MLTNKVTNITVRGMLTKVYLKDDASFKKKAPEDAIAYYDSELKAIFFCISHISLETVIHEITHSYIKASFMDQMPDITPDQFEENVCEIVAHFGSEIIDKANTIHKKLLYLKEAYKNGKSKN